MVKLREEFHHPEDGAIDPPSWLQHVAERRSQAEMDLLQHALSLCQLSGEDRLTLVGTTYLQQGLAMADILDNLNLDITTITAAMVYPTVQYTDLSLEDLSEQLNDNIAKLVKGVAQMDAIGIFYGQSTEHAHNRTQIDNLRKMLLAMAQDVRVVLIKLAERTCIMRGIANLAEPKQIEFAKETQDIYAPLANRLGIAQIKWELEDLSFRYLEPDLYKNIAKQVDQKRTTRNNYIDDVISQLEQALERAGLQEFSVTGRAKHIYSIYRKMHRKDVNFAQIYDVSAVRILVQSIENCYAALGIAHSLWEPIPSEFDDYIAHPKPNGYRSLHTAVIGPEDRNVEVQIRTFAMHEEAELGIAAHWVYKEGAVRQQSSYEQKISWLRNIIDWHKELAHPDAAQKDNPEINLFEDRVYVFTPTGEIIDLPMGSTPLDFAYIIHTDIGHRCKGAKVNGSIVPLTYQLKTGDRIEILTTKYPSPSRDWLNPNLAFLKTPRARAKVHQWFKKQDYDQNRSDGEAAFERELRRQNIEPPNTEDLARQLNFQSADDMFAAIGGGALRVGQVIHALEANQPEEVTEKQFIPPHLPRHIEKIPRGINIEGVDNLLSHLAHCCKPVPGDNVIGFITQGRGVSIHRKDCGNITNAISTHHERLIEVNWGRETGTFPVDIFVDAYDRHGLIRDIGSLLANEKINILAINTVTDQEEQRAKMTITLEIPDLNTLNKIFDRLYQLPNIISVERLRTGL